MTFTPKEWQYSNYEPKIAEYKIPSIGKKYLRIVDAELINDIKMKITFKTLDDEDALFSVWYNLVNADMSINDRSLSNLNSLGYACCGQKTALLPEDLVGCVVIGDIKHSVNKNNPDKPPFVNIYHYDPIDEEIMYLSDRQDQYYVPSEEESEEEDSEEEE